MSAKGLPFLLLALISGARGADWPQYRGPNGDGSSPERIRTDWTNRAPREIWRKPIGPGWSSMTISGGRVLTQVRRPTPAGDREFCIALDAASGEQLWATEVDSAVYTDLSGYSDQIDGPRSTPTIDGDRIYVLTSFLKLYCLRADTGAEIWKRDFVAELGASLIPWESAASPLLVGDLIYLNCNAPNQRLMAVRKSDGGTAWSRRDEGLTHASPVYGTIAGSPQVVFLTSAGLVGMEPLTGAFLWKLDFNPSTTSTAASPFILGDLVYASSAYGYGMWIAKISKSGDTFTATRAVYQQGIFYQSHWATPVEHAGQLFCVPSPAPTQGRLACLDPVGGTNRWTQRQVGSGDISYGSVIKARDILVVLTESGELVLVQPNQTAYIEIAKHKILTQYCWNNVALSNGRIYARNSSFNSEIVALDVKPASPPLPPFGLTIRPADDSSHIRIAAYSWAGALLQEEHAARVEVVASADLTAPAAEWTPIGGSFTYSEGALIVDVPIGNLPGQFLRVHDKEAAAP